MLFRPMEFHQPPGGHAPVAAEGNRPSLGPAVGFLGGCYLIAVSQSQPCPMQQERVPGSTNNRSASQLTKQPVNEQFTQATCSYAQVCELQICRTSAAAQSSLKWVVSRPCRGRAKSEAPNQVRRTRNCRTSRAQSAPWSRAADRSSACRRCSPGRNGIPIP